MNNEDNGVIDWDDMSEEDKANATDLLRQLNKLFDKYTEKDDAKCEDSTSAD
jgi:hypothetical protein